MYHTHNSYGRGSNRRAHPRYRRKQKVKLKVLAAGPTGKRRFTGRVFYCSSEDVSVGGIKFTSRSEIPVNTAFELSIEFPVLNKSFVHSGTVAWSRKDDTKAVHHVGVFFADRDPRTLNAWRKFVRALQQD